MSSWEVNHESQSEGCGGNTCLASARRNSTHIFEMATSVVSDRKEPGEISTSEREAGPQGRLDRARWSSGQLCNNTYWTEVKPEQVQPWTGDWNTVFHFRTCRSSCEPQNLPRFGRRASQKEPSNSDCRKRDTSPEKTRPASSTWPRLRPTAAQEPDKFNSMCWKYSKQGRKGSPKFHSGSAGQRVQRPRCEATCRRKRPLKHDRAPPCGGSRERLVKGNHDWFSKRHERA